MRCGLTCHSGMTRLRLDTNKTTDMLLSGVDVSDNVIHGKIEEGVGSNFKLV